MADKTVFNISPYYDDYDEDKNFLRILFRPGYAVQARELTQAQTILQKQVQRFGDHIFEDGSKVLGAGIITRKVDFVRLNRSYTQNDGTLTNFDSSKILDYELIERKEGVDTRAKVIYTIDPELGAVNDNYHVAFVEFITGSSFTEGATLESTIPTETYDVMAATADSGDGVSIMNGKADLVSVDEGVFYTDGFFVKNQKQNISPHTVGTDGIRVFSNPTCRVGFKTTKTNVTSSTDGTLRDPASGSYNFNSPGGDRYKIQLDLGLKTDTEKTDNQDFIELLRFDSGDITYKLDKTNYAELEKTLARRTYDESGSYTVNPFGIDIREHLAQGDNRGVYSETAGGSSDHLAVGMLPGKAYVFGHEYETQSVEYVPVKKARKTANFSGSFDFAHGNYFVGQIADSDPNGVAENNSGGASWLFTDGDILDTAKEVIIADSATGTFAKLGTAKIHGLDKNTDGNYRIYVYDVKLEPGVSINSAAALYASTANGTEGHTDFLISTIIDNIGVGPDGIGPHLKDENTLLFPLNTGSAVKDITELKYAFKERFIHNDSTGEQTSFSISITDTGLDSSLMSFDTTGLGTPHDAGKFFIFRRINPPTGSTDGRKADSLPDAEVTFQINGESLDVTVPSPGALADGASVTYFIITTIIVNDTSGKNSNVIRKKTLKENKQSSYDGLGGPPASDSLTRIEDENGNVYYELPYSDIYKITSITGTSAAANDENGEQVAFDPSGDLLFDNGQRDNEYLKGRLYVKESVKDHYIAAGSPTSPSLTVNYEYFLHTEGPGPFTVSSYGGGFTYDDIPLYTSKNLRKTFSLANCLDFRHSEVNATPTSRLPDTKPTSSTLQPVTGNYDYYLSRIDKIVINNDLNGDAVFGVVEGADAIIPKPPADRDSAMTLYSLTVPAYTHNPSDVGIKLIENKRYTMKDLGRVENRLDDIEYFTNLSLLENEIDSRVIYTAGSTTDVAFKNGILVDGFRGHNIGDVTHIDYKCSIDYEKGHLRPSFKPTQINLTTPTISSGEGLEISSDGLLTYLQGPTAEYINQASRNTSLKVNPFNLTNWIGTVTLSPFVSNWFDTTARPTVKINSQGENDNWKVTSVNGMKGFGTQWNDWESVWYGIDLVDDNLLDDRKGSAFLNEARVKTYSPVITNKTENSVSSVARDTSTTREEKNRVGLNIRNLPDHLKSRIGDKIVDKSVVPFIEQQTIAVNAYGLKPLTQVYAFFDDVNVDADCKDANDVAGPFTTSWDGSLTNITFTIPANKFETGDKVFRFIDSSTNTIGNAVTSADGVFHAQGILPTRSGSIVSTRPAHLRRITANSEKVIKNPFAKEKNLNLSKYTNWLDPMSQIFYVDDVSYPNGLFLNSVDLYLANAHETIPLKLDIRESFNGSPSPSVVIPFSEIWKSGTGDAGLTYDKNSGTTPTRFNFSSPVFLEPGEYAICLSANSSDFEVHGGVVGELSSNNLNRIISPVYSGPVYRSTNNRAAQVDNTLTWKYKLNRCTFDTLNVENPSVNIKNIANSSSIKLDSYRFNTSSITPTGTFVNHSASFDNDTNIIENTNNGLSSTVTVAGGSQIDMINTSFTVANPSTNSTISPVVDFGYNNIIGIENVVNNLTNPDDELPAFGGDTSATAKYITRRVTLEDNFESSNLKVYLDLNKQGLTADVSVDVFAKISSNSEESEFDDIGYVQMEVENNLDEFISENQFDFREVSYTLPASAVATGDRAKIKSFAVKICMYSNNSANVPVIKDLRIVALDS